MKLVAWRPWNRHGGTTPAKVYEMAGGTPAMFRARYEEDAKLLVREQAGRRRRTRSRREFLLVAALVAVLLVGWGLFELLAV